MYKIKLEDILKVRSIINVYGEDYYDSHYCKNKPYYKLEDINIDKGNALVKEEMMLSYQAHSDLLIKLTTISYDVMRVIPKTLIVEILPLDSNKKDVDLISIDGCIGEGMVLILGETARTYDKGPKDVDGTIEYTKWKISHIDEQILNFSLGAIFSKYDTITQPHLTITDRYARFGSIELDISGVPLELSPKIHYEL